MARLPKKKKKPGAFPKESGAAGRRDLPAAESITGEEEFTSPKGNKYRIIITNELDAYEYDENDPGKPPEAGERSG